MPSGAIERYRTVTDPNVANVRLALQKGKSRKKLVSVETGSKCHMFGQGRWCSLNFFYFSPQRKRQARTRPQTYPKCEWATGSSAAPILLLQFLHVA